MTRRTKRWPAIFEAHRSHLMRSAHELWKDCVPPMVSLRPESADYRSVMTLQAATVTFSKTISGGQSWVSGGSTTPIAYVPGPRIDREAEVNQMLAECEGDPRLAVRVLLDTVAQLEFDQERLLAQM